MIRTKTILSINGSLGVGKTSFVQNLRKLVPNAIYLNEPVDLWLQIKDDESGENLLDLFYSDKKRWSYTFQNVVFITRLNLLLNALADPSSDLIIMDGSLASDKNIYARMLHDDGYMSSIEWNAYNVWDHFSSQQIGVHQVYQVYLKCDPKVVMERVIKRGRPEEHTIDITYLEKLQKYYDQQFINSDPKTFVYPFECQEQSPEYFKILSDLKTLLTQPKTSSQCLQL